MQRHFMTAMLSYRYPLALVRCEGFHRWSAATIEWVAGEFTAIAANESGCAEAARCNPKSDLAPRMPTFFLMSSHGRTRETTGLICLLSISLATSVKVGPMGGDVAISCWRAP
jgi:hypothetical protein